MDSQTTITHPENAEIKTTQNEPAGSGGAESEVGLFGKMRELAQGALTATGGAISGATEKVVSGAKKKIRILKRGRGKPPADGSPGKNDIWEYEEEVQKPTGENVPAGAPPPASESITDKLEAMRPGFMRRVVANITKSVFEIPNYFLGKLIARKHGRQEADAVIKRISPKDEEIDDLALYTDLLLKKYNLEAKYPLELAAASTVISIGSRYAVVAVEYLKKPDREGGENAN